jgi:hypothetical protein
MEIMHRNMNLSKEFQHEIVVISIEEKKNMKKRNMEMI